MDCSSQENLAYFTTNLNNFVAEVNDSYFLNKNSKDDERLKNIKNNINIITICKGKCTLSLYE